jgi:hypothetical protein
LVSELASDFQEGNQRAIRPSDKTKRGEEQPNNHERQKVGTLLRLGT